jgi:UDP-glucose 4-epimerase
VKVLITGSNGYLGSSFIDRYQKRYQFTTFSLLHQKIEDINFRDVNIVLHCAALVHQKEEHSYEKYHEINVTYPLKLAKLAKQNGVQQFVFISTIAVYGEDEEVLNENTICDPVTPYGKSKLEAERQLSELHDDSFVVSIIRVPMVYGKDAPGNIESLVKLVRNVPIIPLGGINNRRSFVYVGNLCWLVDEVIRFRVKLGMTEELKHAMTEEVKLGIKEGSAVTRECHPELDSGSKNIFLACDDEPLSTTRLIELIAKNLNKKVYLVKVPFFEFLLKLLKPSFHKRLYGSLEVDNSLTMKRLFSEVKPSLPFSVQEGIKLMISGENN